MTREERKADNERKKEEAQKKLEEREICKPKRPSTSYVFFVTDNRTKVVKKNPDMKVTDIMR